MTCSSHFFTNLESTILWWAHQVKLRIYESCFQLYLLWFFNCSKLREKKSYWTKFFGANMKLHAFPPAQNCVILAKKLVKTGFVVWSDELITELSIHYCFLCEKKCIFLDILAIIWLIWLSNENPFSRDQNKPSNFVEEKWHS